MVRIASLLVDHRFRFSLPFDRLPDDFPHHLSDPTGPDVETEMKERYQDYIKQSGTIANLMTDWL